MTPEPIASSPQTHIDRAGAVASALCAIHCASVAFIPAAIGALGLSALLDHDAEWVFTAVAILFAGAALASNIRRHRMRLVTTLFALGIVGLLASRVIESSSTHHDDADSHVHATHTDHHEEGAGDEHGEHDAHTLGTLVGVLAGFLLVSGHLLSLRAGQRTARVRA